MVLQLGLSPKYVLDEIQTYEITSLMKHSYYKKKDEWEQARLIAYLIAQTNSTKKLKITDIIKFHWEDIEKDETAVTKEDLEQMMREAEQMRELVLNN